MLGKGGVSDIEVHGGVNDGFANVSQKGSNKKGPKQFSTQFNIKLFRTHKHTNLFYILRLKKINYQFYKAIYQLKYGQKLHHQMNAISGLGHYWNLLQN